MKLIIMALCLTGCAGVQHLSPERAIGGGVATGVVAGEVAKKVKEVFTPQYLLQFESVEVCGLDKPDKVTCYLIPCEDEDNLCSATWDKDEWLAQNPKVMTLRSSLIIPAKHFCQKNPNACDKYIGYYSGYKIFVKEDKN